MYNASSDIVFDNVFLTVRGLGIRCALKLDYFNAAGSIKMKTALGLVLSLEQKGLINRNTTLIESSSGNLGVALSMICAERKYRFICVCDPNISQSNLKLMMALGTRIVQVDTKDSNGGFLGTRIAYVKQKIAADPDCLWLNQYSNPANPETHARTTASSIFNSFTRVNYLFVGAGTTGTLMGCVDFFKKYSPYTKIIAVDSLGSVTFGGPGGNDTFRDWARARCHRCFAPTVCMRWRASRKPTPSRCAATWPGRMACCSEAPPVPSWRV